MCSIKAAGHCGGREEQSEATAGCKLRRQLERRKWRMLASCALVCCYSALSDPGKDGAQGLVQSWQAPALACHGSAMLAQQKKALLRGGRWQSFGVARLFLDLQPELSGSTHASVVLVVS